MITKKFVLKTIDGKVLDINAIVEKLKAKGFEILKKGEDYIEVSFENFVKDVEGDINDIIKKSEAKIKKEIEKIRGVTVGEIIDGTVSFFGKIYLFIKDKAIPFLKKVFFAVVNFFKDKVIPFFKKLFTKK